MSWLIGAAERRNLRDIGYSPQQIKAADAQRRALAAGVETQAIPDGQERAIRGIVREELSHTLNPVAWMFLGVMALWLISRLFE
jgi:hypothetical protein